MHEVVVFFNDGTILGGKLVEANTITSLSLEGTADLACGMIFSSSHSFFFQNNPCFFFFLKRGATDETVDLSTPKYKGVVEAATKG